MIGDMANAYPAGISVEIGINFVNYIIPMFYNFYINKEKTILNCKDLNIVEILDDLLSEKYASLLEYKISIKISNLKESLKTCEKIFYTEPIINDIYHLGLKLEDTDMVNNQVAEESAEPATPQYLPLKSEIVFLFLVLIIFL
jgi:hypothetical protein